MRPLVLMLLSPLGLGAAVAHAQDDAQAGTTPPANGAFRRGLDAFRDGRFEEATETFETCVAQATEEARRIACGELAAESRRRAALPLPPPPDTPPPPDSGQQLGPP